MRRILLILLFFSLIACERREPMPAGWIAVGPGQYWPAATTAGRELERVPKLLREGQRSKALAGLRRAADGLERRESEISPESRDIVAVEARNLKIRIDELETENGGIIPSTRIMRSILETEARFFPPGPGTTREFAGKIDEHFKRTRTLIKERKLSAAARRIQMASGMLRYLTGSATDFHRPRLDRVLRDLNLAAATYLDQGWIPAREFARLEGRARTVLARFLRDRMNENDPATTVDFGAATLLQLQEASVGLKADPAGEYRLLLERTRDSADESGGALDALLVFLEEHYF